MIPIRHVKYYIPDLTILTENGSPWSVTTYYNSPRYTFCLKEPLKDVVGLYVRRLVVYPSTSLVPSDKSIILKSDLSKVRECSYLVDRPSQVIGMALAKPFYTSIANITYDLKERGKEAMTQNPQYISDFWIEFYFGNRPIVGDEKLNYHYYIELEFLTINPTCHEQKTHN
jgi:hypothetical protein